MFRTTDALHDASISVWLPDDVQIAGRPHVRHLSWHTDLKAGPNLLELPLQAASTVLQAPPRSIRAAARGIVRLKGQVRAPVARDLAAR